MTLQLPTSVGSPVARWQLFDWLELSWRTAPAAAAGGTATLTTDQLDPADLWLVDRAVSVCDSTTATTLRLYRDGAMPALLRDGTLSGNLDISEYPNGLLVRPQSSLVAVWSGCSAGAVGVLTAQIRLYRQAAG